MDKQKIIEQYKKEQRKKNEKVISKTLTLLLLSFMIVGNLILFASIYSLSILSNANLILPLLTVFINIMFYVIGWYVYLIKIKKEK